MFHVPLDAIADKSFSLNLIQLDHPNPIPPSPEISLSSSPASLSCSSLKAWRSTSEQLQSPIRSFSHPIHCNVAAVTSNSSHEHPGQHISCVTMSALDIPPSQEQAIPSVEEDELGDLHWTTGVPYHMMDVFRAEPFAPMDLPPISTTRPSLDNPTNPSSSHCKIGVLHHTRSATKHVLTPDEVEQKKKSRRKRARNQSPPVVPFPSTGPQEMFAYEFRLEIPYRNNRVFLHEDNQQREDLHASYSLATAMDDRGHLHIPRPVMAYGSEDVCMRLPLAQDMGLYLPPYPCSLTASIPPKIRPEHHMQPPHYPLFPVPLSTHMSPRLQDPSSSASSIPRQGIDKYWPQFDEHGCYSLPRAVPMQDTQESTRGYRLSSVSAASLVQKPLYACPLCPRDFQLPNGLALHLKWHDRVENITQDPTRCLSRRVAPRQTDTASSPLDTRDVRLAQIPAREDGQQCATAGSTSIPYVAMQESNFAQAESVSETLECGHRIG